MTVALRMEMEQEYKKRRYWYDCSKCNHLIAPEGERKICDCNPPEPVKQHRFDIKIK